MGRKRLLDAKRHANAAKKNSSASSKGSSPLMDKRRDSIDSTGDTGKSNHIVDRIKKDVKKGFRQSLRASRGKRTK